MNFIKRFLVFFCIFKTAVTFQRNTAVFGEIIQLVTESENSQVFGFNKSL